MSDLWPLAFVALLPILLLVAILRWPKPPPRETAAKPPRSVPTQAYYTGLRHLLNDDSDKALDVFISMLRVDSDTVETHITVGSLFRRRGEIDRAIRIHENVIARPDLAQAHRDETLFQLGCDYVAAGLLDRAERVFALIDDNASQSQAAGMQQLLLLEIQRQWSAAVALAEELQTRYDIDLGHRRMHYHCEAAALDGLSDTLREQALSAATDADPLAARPKIMAAELAYAQRNWRAAIKYYRQAEHLEPIRAPDFVAPLLDALQQLADPEPLREYLDEVTSRRNSASTLRVVAELLEQSEGTAAAQAFLQTQLQRRASLRGLLMWSEFAQKTTNDSADELRFVFASLTQILERQPTHGCQNCGFSSDKSYWQCPACRTWDAIEPIVGGQGE